MLGRLLSMNSLKSFLYERVDESNTLSSFVVGRTRSEYGLPMAVIPDS